MALFRRNKAVISDMPSEAQDYYQAESRPRSAMAWLLALGTLLVTVAVILGLFLGGRLVVRKLRHTDKSTPLAVQSPTSAQKNTSPSSSTNGSSSTGSSSNHSTSTNAPSTGTSSTTTGTSSATTGKASDSSTPSTAASAPNSSQAASANLPTTGPGNTLAVFIFISVLAYFVHRKFSTQQ